MKKLESIKSSKFEQFKKNEISNLHILVGGDSVKTNKAGMIERVGSTTDTTLTFVSYDTNSPTEGRTGPAYSWDTTKGD